MTPLALSGYASVARALAYLLRRQRCHYSFRITGTHSYYRQPPLHYGTAIRPPRSAARGENVS